MIHGLYASAAGMLVQDARHDVIAQNLANVSTTGYRKQEVTFSAFNAKLASQFPLTPAASPAANNTQPITAVPFLNLVTERASYDAQGGDIRVTGNKTDLALQGDGYFTVRDAGGNECYTRDGTFFLNAHSQLVTAEGKQLLGEAGPIQIGSANWDVTPDGTVHVNGRAVDHLKLVTFNLNTASPVPGGNLWKSAAVTKAPATVQVRQEALENSNVNSIAEMVALINTTRQYEANQKCLQAQDTTLDHAVNEIAR